MNISRCSGESSRNTPPIPRQSPPGPCLRRGALELFHHLSRIQLDASQVLVHLPGEVAAEPRGRTELHAVGHLVDRDPQPEVLGGEGEPPFDLDDVRADEVQQPLVVGREEHVVLPEDLARDVADQHAGLRAERLPLVVRARGTPVEHALGERLEQTLQPVEVRADPIGARHHPGTRTEPLDLHVGEAADQSLGARDDLGHVLAEPRTLHAGNRHTRARDAAADIDGGLPVGQTGRVGAHRPVEGVGGVHRGEGD